VTRRRPKWIRGKASDVFDTALWIGYARPAGYKPGDAVVVMSAAEARELKRDVKSWRELAYELNDKLNRKALEAIES